MSTWFTESFRGQLLWDLAKCRALTFDEWKELASKCDIYFAGGLLEATGDYPSVRYPTGTAKELCNPSSRDHKSFCDIFFYSQRIKPANKNFGYVSKYINKRSQKFICGLESVYKLYILLEKDQGLMLGETARDSYKWCLDYIVHSLYTTSYAMKSQPIVIDKVIKRIEKSYLLKAEQWLSKCKSVRNLITMRWHGKCVKASIGTAAPVNMSAHRNLHLNEDWEVFFDGWVTYLRNNEMEYGVWYALTTVDLDRLQQMCMSRCMYELHGAIYSLTAGNDMSIYKISRSKIDRVFTSAIENVNRDTAQTLCRDMKKAFNIYLSIISGPLSDEGTKNLKNEAKQKGYVDSFEFNQYINVLRQIPLDLAQDLGRIYKLLPAPDYDIGESFVARQQQHLNPHPTSTITGDNPCNFEEFRKYMRKLAIITLVKRNKHKGVGKLKNVMGAKWYQSYMDKGTIPDGLDWVDDLDLTGVVPYVERHKDSVTSWKDTAATEEDLDEAMEEHDPLYYKRNMLLRFLFDPMCPTHAQARRGLKRSEHVHRVGFKMEAHKDKARLFFIGNLMDRLVQSEMEENIHEVALMAPGYMIGQSADYTVTKIMKMVAPDLKPNQRVYYLNFDLNAWSPGMCKEVQRISHSLWAEIFDRQEFRNAHLINENSIIVLNKRGYKGIYINPQANFEGYNGKENTFLHCALMGYSVYRYRRATGHQASVDLCAFIDDGLATFIDDVEHGPNRFMNLVKIMEETYRCLGFELERSKCNLSDTFATFLNEIYYEGRHITYGLRALMRIGTQPSEPYDTIIDKINRYMSGSQGAMKAGLDAIPTYFAFLWNVAHCLLDYSIDKFMDHKAASLYSYTPKALGGLGLPGFVALATNYVSDSLAENIAILQSIAKTYPAIQDKICKILRQPIAEKSPLGVLISPRTVKPDKAEIVESRLKRAIAKKLTSIELAPHARRLIGLAKGQIDDVVADAIVNANVNLSETILMEIRECLPSSIINALVKKFESSRTIQLLLGRGEVKQITKKNLADVYQSFRHFKNRLM